MQTFHASAAILGTKGIVVGGPSRSGKTSLIRHLIEEWQRFDRYSAWIGDDQLILEKIGDALLARTPDNIAGLAEQRGFGLVPIDHQLSARIDLVVELIPSEAVQSMPERQVDRYFGLVPAIQAPQSDLLYAASLIKTALANKSGPIE